MASNQNRKKTHILVEILITVPHITVDFFCFNWSQAIGSLHKRCMVGNCVLIVGHGGRLKRGVTQAHFNTKHCCETNCYKLVFFHIIGLQRGPCGASPWARDREWGRGQGNKGTLGNQLPAAGRVRLKGETRLLLQQWSWTSTLLKKVT